MPDILSVQDFNSSTASYLQYCIFTISVDNLAALRRLSMVRSADHGLTNPNLWHLAHFLSSSRCKGLVRAVPSLWGYPWGCHAQIDIRIFGEAVPNTLGHGTLLG